MFTLGNWQHLSSRCHFHDAISHPHNFYTRQIKVICPQNSELRFNGPSRPGTHPWVIFEANVWDALMGWVWIMCHFEFEVGYTRPLKCIQLWLFPHWSNIQTAVQRLKMNQVKAKRRPGFKRRAVCLLSGWALANYLTPSVSLIHSL